MIASVLNELRCRADLETNLAHEIPGILSIHSLDSSVNMLSGIFVSAPFPEHNNHNDIPILSQVDRKRISTRSYKRSDIPLWLVIGITADFGQLEITCEKIASKILETQPFDKILITDGFQVLEVTLHPLYQQHDRLGRAWHEAGHAVAAIRNGIPLVSVTIDKIFAREGGFTEISGDAEIGCNIDSIFTAAGAAAQLRSKFTPENIVNHVSQDDREKLENDIARGTGLSELGERYLFAEDAFCNAERFVESEQRAIDAIGNALYHEGTLSARRCEIILTSLD